MELELPSSSSAPSETRLDEHDEDYHELTLSPSNPIDPPSDVAIPDSRALVIVSPRNAEAHPVVPMNPKNRCSELSQRRTRRPFSVAEVEALVEAVEQLGTGRYLNYIISCSVIVLPPYLTIRRNYQKFVILQGSAFLLISEYMQVA